MNREEEIVKAWKANATQWIDAVRNEGVRDFCSATQRILLDTIKQYSTPVDRVLDVGCGEGWLANRLAEEGYRAVGVDISETLLEEARKNGRAKFLHSNQNELNVTQLGMFNVIICNFSLFGDSSVEDFCKSIKWLLQEDGKCIIQTLHPLQPFSNEKYETGWIKGTWANLRGSFSAPPPLYFRTIEGWSKLFSDAGLCILNIVEPRNGQDLPISKIFVLGVR